MVCRGGIFDFDENSELNLGAETRDYTESWLDHASTSFSGRGTKEEPYLVSSAADLAYISAVVNEKRFERTLEGYYFRQTADIDLSGYLWQPIGDWGYFFAANYDGCGYTISNMYCKDFVYGALFGACYYSTLSNIKIKSSIVENCTMAGGLVTYITAGVVENCESDTMLINCRSGGGVVCSTSGTSITSCFYSGVIDCSAEGESATKVDYVGGIVGSGGQCTISFCQNNGSIIAENVISVGGIDGIAESDTIENCVQNGTIYIKSTLADAYAGAFIGKANIYGGGGVPTVKNCEGYGSIIVKSGALASSQSANIQNSFFIGAHNIGVKYALTVANSITSCYAICNGEKFRSSGTFSDFRIVTGINNGMPVPVSRYHVAQFGENVQSSFWNGYNSL